MKRKFYEIYLNGRKVCVVSSLTKNGAKRKAKELYGNVELKEVK